MYRRGCERRFVFLVSPPAAERHYDPDPSQDVILNRGEATVKDPTTVSSATEVEKIEMRAAGASPVHAHRNPKLSEGSLGSARDLAR